MAKIRRPHLALIAILVSAFSGCQLVLGDYRVDGSGLAPSGRRVCQVDEYRCSGAMLQVCNRDRSDWIDFEECLSVDECNLNSAACRPCRAGEEYQCNAGYLLACTADAKWMQASDGFCGTQSLCSAAERRCTPERCEADKHQCEGAALQRCSPGRDTFQLVTTCDSPELCKPAVADQQAAQGKPVTCVVTCDRATSSCGAANCDTPGTLRCSSDAIQLQRCSEKFEWTEVETCKSFQLCNLAEAKCDPPACAVGDRRCTRSTVETCRADRAGWQQVRECGAGELCDPAAAVGAECVTGPCAEGTDRCNSIFLERCEGGTWQRKTKCKSRCDVIALACDPA